MRERRRARAQNRSYLPIKFLTAPKLDEHFDGKRGLTMSTQCTTFSLWARVPHELNPCSRSSPLVKKYNRPALQTAYLAVHAHQQDDQLHRTRCVVQNNFSLHLDLGTSKIPHAPSYIVCHIRKLDLRLFVPGTVRYAGFGSGNTSSDSWRLLLSNGRDYAWPNTNCERGV